MAPPLFGNPETLPLNVLFPDAYDASKRMIVKDFALVGFAIVMSVVVGALANLAVNG